MRERQVNSKAGGFAKLCRVAILLFRKKRSGVASRLYISCATGPKENLKRVAPVA
jgi:hypothetical protein